MRFKALTIKDSNMFPLRAIKAKSFLLSLLLMTMMLLFGSNVVDCNDIKWYDMLLTMFIVRKMRKTKCLFVLWLKRDNKPCSYIKNCKKLKKLRLKLSLHYAFVKKQYFCWSNAFVVCLSVMSLLRMLMFLWVLINRLSLSCFMQYSTTCCWW